MCCQKNGKQCTIKWHVDNLIKHDKKKVEEDIIEDHAQIH